MTKSKLKSIVLFQPNSVAGRILEDLIATELNVVVQNLTVIFLEDSKYILELDEDMPDLIILDFNSDISHGETPKLVAKIQEFIQYIQKRYPKRPILFLQDWTSPEEFFSLEGFENIYTFNTVEQQSIWRKDNKIQPVFDYLNLLLKEIRKRLSDIN